MKTIVSGFALLFFAACATSSSPSEREGLGVYKFQFDFLWDGAQKELKDGWKIESAVKETRTIKTEWDQRLSPFNTFGTRNRITVTFAGDDVAGWKMTCKQESEQNTNQIEPLNPKEADWEGSDNDGSLAGKFVQNFDRRVTPNERWRREAAR